MNKIIVNIIEVLLIDAALVALFLVAEIEPSFGWFIYQPAVFIVVAGGSMAFEVWKVIESVCELISENKSLHTTEGVE